MEIDLSTMLVLIRCSALTIIVLMVGKYHPDPDARERPGISLLAALFCGSAAGWAMYGFASLQVHTTPAREVLPTLFVLAITIPVVRTQGNLAKLFPRLRWSDRP